MADRALVERAQHGDRDAYERLALEASDRLFQVAYRIVRDVDLANDAVQQTLVAMWCEMPSLRDADRFEAWTYRLVVHFSLAEVRRHQRARVTFSPLTEDVPEPREDIGQVALRDEIGRAFIGLTPEHRAVIVLHYYVGLPLTEIAVALGVPYGTVGSRLHRATGQMRALLERRCTHRDGRGGDGMTGMTDLDRQLTSWLDADGPGPVATEVVHAALATARTRPQRRRLAWRRSWPRSHGPRPRLAGRGSGRDGGRRGQPVDIVRATVGPDRGVRHRRGGTAHVRDRGGRSGPLLGLPTARASSVTGRPSTARSRSRSRASRGRPRIAAGPDDTCALLGGGELRCWGFNANGELVGSAVSGGEPIPDVPVPTDIAGAERRHRCGDARGSPLRAAVGRWHPLPGAGGQQSTRARSTSDPSPAIVQVDGTPDTVAIVAGDVHTCALTADGRVGARASPATVPVGVTGSDTPVEVQGIEGATAIAAGGGRTCAIVADGRVGCWGQTGVWTADGNAVEDLLPVEIPGVSGATALSRRA